VADATLPIELSIAELMGAIEPLSGAVVACFEDSPGAIVSLTISGRSGRVDNASVRGLSGSRATCAARLLREIEVSKFQASRCILELQARRLP
jgi:hypothetical protein